MLLIDCLMLQKVFSVDKFLDQNFTEGVFWSQLATSLASMFMCFINLEFERKALNEEPFEYLCTLLKNRVAWIPFGKHLENRTLFKDINYGAIELKKYSSMYGSNETG